MAIHKKTAETKEKRLLQWHPAFYAGIQIEFGEEAKSLTFRQEYPLGSRPRQIDVLIRKQKNKVIHKNFGRIFREHNIVEYKGPGDYLSIDDFYKVYGYTCFYKAEAQKTNSVKFEELTITFVSESYPKELIRYLRKQRKLEVQCAEPGIYYVIGDVLPIQIIVTRNLSERENLWLRSLTNRLRGKAEAEVILGEYEKHRNDKLYESMMEIIMQANKDSFKEVVGMCKALEELIIEVAEERAVKMAEIKAEEMAEARAVKIAEIKKVQGENRVNELNLKLSKLGRLEDIIKSAANKSYQEQLFAEFGL